MKKTKTKFQREFTRLLKINNISFIQDYTIQDTFSANGAELVKSQVEKPMHQRPFYGGRKSICKLDNVSIWQRDQFIAQP